MVGNPPHSFPLFSTYEKLGGLGGGGGSFTPGLDIYTPKTYLLAHYSAFTKMESGYESHSHYEGHVNTMESPV
jgi:hypothetical protein